MYVYQAEVCSQSLDRHRLQKKMLVSTLHNMYFDKGNFTFKSNSNKIVLSTLKTLKDLLLMSNQLTKGKRPNKKNIE